ncbi:MAG: RNA 2',3'-cyclic phosphodiesterase [Wenzhouxiangellaceae bacterium]
MAGASQRLFFALWPEPAVRQQLLHWQQAAAAVEANGGRPVRALNLHITLAFLGELTPSQQQASIAAAAQLHLPPVELVIDHFGHFPGARVLYAAPSQIPGVARSLQQQLCAALSGHGLELEQRPWAPHVTLYRKVRQLPPLPRLPAIEWPVRGLSLVESCSRPGGVVYEQRRQWPLQ